MTMAISERIEALDGKQAIFQVKILLQSAIDGAPGLLAMNGPAIANELKIIAADDQETLAKASALATKAPAEPLPAQEAGAMAKELLRIFATAPGGEAILNSALDKMDESGDFGLITLPLICTFMSLTVVGEFDLQLGGFRYRKKGLTAEQQAKLLKSALPTALKSLIKSAFNSADT